MKTGGRESKEGQVTRYIEILTALFLTLAHLRIICGQMPSFTTSPFTCSSGLSLPAQNPQFRCLRGKHQAKLPERRRQDSVFPSIAHQEKSTYPPEHINLGFSLCLPFPTFCTQHLRQSYSLPLLYGKCSIWPGSLISIASMVHDVILLPFFSILSPWVLKKTHSIDLRQMSVSQQSSCCSLLCAGFASMSHHAWICSFTLYFYCIWHTYRKYKNTRHVTP